MKCLTCTNRITSPHEFNNFDLWCSSCHAKARKCDSSYENLKRNFQRHCAKDGHNKRGNTK